MNDDDDEDEDEEQDRKSSSSSSTSYEICDNQTQTSWSYPDQISSLQFDYVLHGVNKEIEKQSKNSSEKNSHRSSILKKLHNQIRKYFEKNDVNSKESFESNYHANGIDENYSSNGRNKELNKLPNGTKKKSNLSNKQQQKIIDMQQLVIDEQNRIIESVKCVHDEHSILVENERFLIILLHVLQQLNRFKNRDLDERVTKKISFGKKISSVSISNSSSLATIKRNIPNDMNDSHKWEKQNQIVQRNECRPTDTNQLSIISTIGLSVAVSNNIGVQSQCNSHRNDGREYLLQSIPTSFNENHIRTKNVEELKLRLELLTDLRDYLLQQAQQQDDLLCHSNKNKYGEATSQVNAISMLIADKRSAQALPIHQLSPNQQPSYKINKNNNDCVNSKIGKVRSNVQLNPQHHRQIREQKQQQQQQQQQQQRQHPHLIAHQQQQQQHENNKRSELKQEHLFSTSSQMKYSTNKIYVDRKVCQLGSECRRHECQVHGLPSHGNSSSNTVKRDSSTNIFNSDRYTSNQTSIILTTLSYTSPSSTLPPKLFYLANNPNYMPLNSIRDPLAPSLQQQQQQQQQQFRQQQKYYSHGINHHQKEQQQQQQRQQPVQSIMSQQLLNSLNLKTKTTGKDGLMGENKSFTDFLSSFINTRFHNTRNCLKKHHGKGELKVSTNTYDKTKHYSGDHLTKKNLLSSLSPNQKFSHNQQQEQYNSRNKNSSFIYRNHSQLNRNNLLNNKKKLSKNDNQNHSNSLNNLSKIKRSLTKKVFKQLESQLNDICLNNLNNNNNDNNLENPHRIQQLLSLAETLINIPLSSSSSSNSDSSSSFNSLSSMKSCSSSHDSLSSDCSNSETSTSICSKFLQSIQSTTSSSDSNSSQLLTFILYSIIFHLKNHRHHHHHHHHRRHHQLDHKERRRGKSKNHRTGMDRSANIYNRMKLRSSLKRKNCLIKKLCDNKPLSHHRPHDEQYHNLSKHHHYHRHHRHSNRVARHRISKRRLSNSSQYSQLNRLNSSILKKYLLDCRDHYNNQQEQLKHKKDFYHLGKNNSKKIPVKILNNSRMFLENSLKNTDSNSSGTVKNNDMKNVENNTEEFIRSIEQCLADLSEELKFGESRLSNGLLSSMKMKKSETVSQNQIQFPIKFSKFHSLNQSVDTLQHYRMSTCHQKIDQLKNYSEQNTGTRPLSDTFTLKDLMQNNYWPITSSVPDGDLMNNVVASRSKTLTYNNRLKSNLIISSSQNHKIEPINQFDIVQSFQNLKTSTIISTVPTKSMDLNILKNNKKPAPNQSSNDIVNESIVNGHPFETFSQLYYQLSHVLKIEQDSTRRLQLMKTFLILLKTLNLLHQYVLCSSQEDLTIPSPLQLNSDERNDVESFMNKPINNTACQKELMELHDSLLRETPKLLAIRDNLSYEIPSTQTKTGKFSSIKNLHDEVTSTISKLSLFLNNNNNNNNHNNNKNMKNNKEENIIDVNRMREKNDQKNNPNNLLQSSITFRNNCDKSMENDLISSTFFSNKRNSLNQLTSISGTSGDMKSNTMSITTTAPLNNRKKTVRLREKKPSYSVISFDCKTSTSNHFTTTGAQHQSKITSSSQSPEINKPKSKRKSLRKQATSFFKDHHHSSNVISMTSHEINRSQTDMSYKPSKRNSMTEKLEQITKSKNEDKRWKSTKLNISSGRRFNRMKLNNYLQSIQSIQSTSIPPDKILMSNVDTLFRDSKKLKKRSFHAFCLRTPSINQDPFGDHHKLSSVIHSATYFLHYIIMPGIVGNCRNEQVRNLLMNSTSSIVTPQSDDNDDLFNPIIRTSVDHPIVNRISRESTHQLSSFDESFDVQKSISIDYSEFESKTKIDNHQSFNQPTKYVNCERKLEESQIIQIHSSTHQTESLHKPIRELSLTSPDIIVSSNERDELNSMIDSPLLPVDNGSITESFVNDPAVILQEELLNQKKSIDYGNSAYLYFQHHGYYPPTTYIAQMSDNIEQNLTDETIQQLNIPNVQSDENLSYILSSMDADKTMVTDQRETLYLLNQMKQDSFFFDDADKSLDKSLDSLQQLPSFSIANGDGFHIKTKKDNSADGIASKAKSFMKNMFNILPNQTSSTINKTITTTTSAVVQSSNIDRRNLKKRISVNILKDFISHNSPTDSSISNAKTAISVSPLTIINSTLSISENEKIPVSSVQNQNSYETLTPTTKTFVTLPDTSIYFSTHSPQPQHGTISYCRSPQISFSEDAQKNDNLLKVNQNIDETESIRRLSLLKTNLSHQFPSFSSAYTSIDSGRRSISNNSIRSKRPSPINRRLEAMELTLCDTLSIYWHKSSELEKYEKFILTCLSYLVYSDRKYNGVTTFNYSRSISLSFIDQLPNCCDKSLLSLSVSAYQTLEILGELSRLDDERNTNLQFNKYVPSYISEYMKNEISFPFISMNIKLIQLQFLIYSLVTFSLISQASCKIKHQSICKGNLSLLKNLNNSSFHHNFIYLSYMYERQGQKRNRLRRSLSSSCVDRCNRKLANRLYNWNIAFTSGRNDLLGKSSIDLSQPKPNDNYLLPIINKHRTDHKIQKKPMSQIVKSSNNRIENVSCIDGLEDEGHVFKKVTKENVGKLPENSEKQLIINSSQANSTSTNKLIMESSSIDKTERGSLFGPLTPFLTKAKEFITKAIDEDFDNELRAYKSSSYFVATNNLTQQSSIAESDRNHIYENVGVFLSDDEACLNKESPQINANAQLLAFDKKIPITTETVKLTCLIRSTYDTESCGTYESCDWDMEKKGIEELVDNRKELENNSFNNYPSMKKNENEIENCDEKKPHSDWCVCSKCTIDRVSPVILNCFLQQKTNDTLPDDYVDCDDDINFPSTPFKSTTPLGFPLGNAKEKLLKISTSSSLSSTISKRFDKNKERKHEEFLKKFQRYGSPNIELYDNNLMNMNKNDIDDEISYYSDIMKKKWEDQWDRLYHEQQKQIFQSNMDENPKKVNPFMESIPIRQTNTTKNKMMKIGSSQRSMSIESLQIQMQDVHKLRLVNKHPRLRRMSSDDFHSAQNDQNNCVLNKWHWANAAEELENEQNKFDNFIQSCYYQDHLLAQKEQKQKIISPNYSEDDRGKNSTTIMETDRISSKNSSSSEYLSENEIRSTKSPNPSLASTILSHFRRSNTRSRSSSTRTKQSFNFSRSSSRASKRSNSKNDMTFVVDYLYNNNNNNNLENEEENKDKIIPLPSDETNEMIAQEIITTNDEKIIGNDESKKPSIQIGSANEAWQQLLSWSHLNQNCKQQKTIHKKEKVTWKMLTKTSRMPLFEVFRSHDGPKEKTKNTPRLAGTASALLRVAALKKAEASGKNDVRSRWLNAIHKANIQVSLQTKKIIERKNRPHSIIFSSTINDRSLNRQQYRSIRDRSNAFVNHLLTQSPIVPVATSALTGSSQTKRNEMEENGQLCEKNSFNSIQYPEVKLREKKKEKNDDSVERCRDSKMEWEDTELQLLGIRKSIAQFDALFNNCNNEEMLKEFEQKLMHLLDFDMSDIQSFHSNFSVYPDISDQSNAGSRSSLFDGTLSKKQRQRLSRILSEDQMSLNESLISKNLWKRSSILKDCQMSSNPRRQSVMETSVDTLKNNLKEYDNHSTTNTTEVSLIDQQTDESTKELNQRIAELQNRGGWFPHFVENSTNAQFDGNESILNEIPSNVYGILRSKSQLMSDHSAFFDGLHNNDMMTTSNMSSSMQLYFHRSLPDLRLPNKYQDEKKNECNTKHLSLLDLESFELTFVRQAAISAAQKLVNECNEDIDLMSSANNLEFSDAINKDNISQDSNSIFCQSNISTDNNDLQSESSTSTLKSQQVNSDRFTSTPVRFRRSRAYSGTSVNFSRIGQMQRLRTYMSKLTSKVQSFVYRTFIEEETDMENSKKLYSITEEENEDKLSSNEESDDNNLLLMRNCRERKFSKPSSTTSRERKRITAETLGSYDIIDHAEADDICTEAQIMNEQLEQIEKLEKTLLGKKKQKIIEEHSSVDGSVKRIDSMKIVISPTSTVKSNDTLTLEYLNKWRKQLLSHQHSSDVVAVKKGEK
ncbi:hypothetical protein SNEBB_010564 [Seison nebaliae]|nr:hypothetical protein SNEBB_010564 [Seison nebaliae]